MSYNLILSETFDGAYKGLTEKLKANLAANPMQSHYVIVPDKFSLTLEKRILSDLGLRGSVSVRVMSFTRMAAYFLKGKIKACLTPEGAVMLLQKVISENKASLKRYAGAAETAGFAGEMYAAITAFRNSGISPDRLKAAHDRIPGGKLKAKIADIGLLYTGYLEALQDRHSDSSTRLEAFAATIGNLQEIVTANIYVTDFYMFTAPQYAILRELLLHAASLNVAIVSGEGENSRIYPSHTLLKLNNLGKEEGIVPDRTVVPSEAGEPFLHIARNLYAYGKVNAAECGDKIRIFRADNPYAEVEDAGERIRYLITEKGVRFKDIAVVAGNIDSYAPVIEKVFARFNIPYFLDLKKPLSGQAGIRFILSLLRAAQTSETDDVFEFCRNPVFTEVSGISRADIDAAENFCLKRNIKYFSGDVPSGAEDGKTRETLSAITAFIPKIAKSGTASYYTSKAEGILERLGFESVMEKIARAQRDSGDGDIAKCTVQLYGYIVSVLEEIDKTLGDMKVTFAEFTDIFAGMTDKIKIAITPLYIDCVFVGETSESRYDDVKYMFVIGATEGNIPAEGGDAAVISAADRENLEKADVLLYPSRLQACRNEWFYITQLLARPSEGLYVYYPEKTFENDCRPSNIIMQLKDMFVRDGKPVAEEKIADDKIALCLRAGDTDGAVRILATRENAFYTLLSRAVNEKPDAKSKPFYDAAYTLLDSEGKNKIARYAVAEELPYIAEADKLFFRGRTSVSQMECYFACPYKHFLRYGLRLLKREEGEVRNTLAGSFVHAVLEKYFNLFVSGELSFETVGSQEIKTAVEKAAEEVVGEDEFRVFSASGKNASTYRRLVKECVYVCEALTSLQQNSQYRPYRLEAGFGDGAEYPPVPVKTADRTLKLKGYIDRIDTCGDRFYIIDYKSYNKDLEVRDVYCGRAVQLVAYMYALAAAEGRKPSGVFYLPVTSGYFKTESPFKMHGFVTENADEAVKLDKNVAVTGTSELFPVSADLKKGVAIKNLKNVFSDEQFENIGVYVIKLIGQAADEIESGYINPSPLSDSCELCDYAKICAYKNVCVKREPGLGVKKEFFGGGKNG